MYPDMEGFNPGQPDSRDGFEFVWRSNAGACRGCVLPMPFLACRVSALFLFFVFCFFFTAKEKPERWQAQCRAHLGRCSAGMKPRFWLHIQCSVETVLGGLHLVEEWLSQMWLLGVWVRRLCWEEQGRVCEGTAWGLVSGLTFVKPTSESFGPSRRRASKKEPSCWVIISPEPLAHLLLSLDHSSSKPSWHWPVEGAQATLGPG